jgi:hypothetical protein
MIVPPLFVMLLASKNPPLLSVPPELTVMPPVPKAVRLPAVAVPALMVVPPVYAFAPERVSVPVPALTKPPAPEITPL